MEKKYYFIDGTRWMQGEIPFRKFGKVVEFIRREFRGIDFNKKETLIDTLIEIVEKKPDQVFELLNMIVEPAPIPLWKKILYLVLSEPEFKPISEPKLNDVVEVLFDFFTLNSKWMKKFGFTLNVSDLLLALGQAMMKPGNLTWFDQFMRSPKEESQKPKA